MNKNTNNLYEMTTRFNNIMDLVLDDSMDLVVLKKALQEVESDITVKCSDGIGLIKSLELYRDGMKAESDRLKNNSKSIDNKIKSIKNWYMENMTSLKKEKVQTNRGTMSIQPNPAALEIVNETLIPAKYLTIVPEHTEINTAKIKEDLKAGIKIAGATLITGKSLRIR